MRYPMTKGRLFRFLDQVTEPRFSINTFTHSCWDMWIHWETHTGSLTDLLGSGLEDISANRSPHLIFSTRKKPGESEIEALIRFVKRVEIYCRWFTEWKEGSYGKDKE